MTVIASLEILPMKEEGLSEEIEKALQELENHDVSYETNAMNTVIQAENLDKLMEASKAAHRAVDGKRVMTTIVIDDDRSRNRSMEEKLNSVQKTS